jgi:hypothetical protein
VSGRRVYPRFGKVASADGQVRISRDVVVEADEITNEISVLTDSPVAVGEQMTLALVNSAGGVDMPVTVLDSRPDIADGRLRHRLLLGIASKGSLPK